MDDMSKKGKEKGGSASAPSHRRKGGLKFKPRVPTKKPKRVPKELEVESNFETIDEDLLLKLRRPQSTSALERRSKAENNEICDEDNFSEFSPSTAQDGELTAAQELGLMVSRSEKKHFHVNGTDTDDITSEPQLFFVQFPSSLPLPRHVESVAEADMDTSGGVETEGTKSKENDKTSRRESIHGCNLKDLPGGLMGKVLVYKSGKVKMRLGDALFDVSAGLDCAFAQEAVAINAKKKHCCSLGQVSKRVVVTPDVDCLVDSVNKVE